MFPYAREIERTIKSNQSAHALVGSLFDRYVILSDAERERFVLALIAELALILRRPQLP